MGGGDVIPTECAERREVTRCPRCGAPLIAGQMCACADDGVSPTLAAAYAAGRVPAGANVPGWLAGMPRRAAGRMMSGADALAQLADGIEQSQRIDDGVCEVCGERHGMAGERPAVLSGRAARLQLDVRAQLDIAAERYAMLVEHGLDAPPPGPPPLDCGSPTCPLCPWPTGGADVAALGDRWTSPVVDASEMIERAAYADPAVPLAWARGDAEDAVMTCLAGDRAALEAALSRPEVRLTAGVLAMACASLVTDAAERYGMTPAGVLAALRGALADDA